MNTPAIITDVRYARSFEGRDGSRRYCFDIDFKIPFSTKDGKLCFDNFVGSYCTDATQKNFDETMQLTGREVQFICYFNINPVKCKDDTVRHFQQCNIRNIFPRSYESAE